MNSEGKGGESTYTDSFAIAEAIRAVAPVAFELLTTMPIPHNRRHPGEIDVQVHAPLIRLDWTGRISGVRYFDRAMSPFDLPHDMIGPMYEAIPESHKRMVSPEFRAEIKLSGGDAALMTTTAANTGATPSRRPRPGASAPATWTVKNFTDGCGISARGWARRDMTCDCPKALVQHEEKERRRCSQKHSPENPEQFKMLYFLLSTTTHLESTVDGAISC